MNPSTTAYVRWFSPTLTCWAHFVVIHSISFDVSGRWRGEWALSAFFVILSNCVCNDFISNFRSFQTSIQLFNPDIVIILGDVFDEGNWVNHKGFQEYVDRFKAIFRVPPETRLYAVHGNHDINFHYRMHSYLISRFNDAFNTTGVRLIHEKKVLSDGTKKMFNFVTVNSMAMEGDGCELCSEAENQIKAIAKKLEKLQKNSKFSAPIILQHFPTFRESDEACQETNSVHSEKYREKWETLSASATNFIKANLQPRLFLSGHSHHFCRLNNSVGVEEFTIASFNWRNINNPSFLLAAFTAEEYSMSLCELPRETTVIGCYAVGVLVILVCAVCDVVRRLKSRRKIRIE